MLNRKVLTCDDIDDIEGTITVPRWMDAAMYTRWLELVGDLDRSEGLPQEEAFKIQLGFVIDSDITFTDPGDGEKIKLDPLNKCENPLELPHAVLMRAVGHINGLIMRSVPRGNSTGQSGDTPKKSGTKQKKSQ